MAPSRSHQHRSSQSSQAVPTSVPDTQLGLTSDEIHTLRYHQQVALAHHQQTSASSSTRAPSSNASSQGRLLLDPTSLTLLSHHFDRLLYSIQQRYQQLHIQCQQATAAQQTRAQGVMEDADAQIARFEEILRQIDEVSLEFQKIKRIGEIVKSFRARVEALERRI